MPCEPKGPDTASALLGDLLTTIEGRRNTLPVGDPKIADVERVAAILRRATGRGSGYATAYAGDPRAAIEREIADMFAEAEARGIPSTHLPGWRDLRPLTAPDLVETRRRLATVLGRPRNRGK